MALIGLVFVVLAGVFKNFDEFSGKGKAKPGSALLSMLVGMLLVATGLLGSIIIPDSAPAEMVASGELSSLSGEPFTIDDGGNANRVFYVYEDEKLVEKTIKGGAKILVIEIPADEAERYEVFGSYPRNWVSRFDAVDRGGSPQIRQYIFYVHLDSK